MNFASERARLLLGQFRRGEANDPGTFITGVAAVLARYSSEIVVTVTDPRTGLASKTDWLPTIKEITEACETLATQDQLRAKREAVVEQTLADREKEPNRATRPTMEQLREKFGPNWGFKEANRLYGDAYREREATLDQRAREATNAAILSEYARLGMDPVYAGNDLISPSLIGALGRWPFVQRERTETDPPEAA